MFRNDAADVSARVQQVEHGGFDGLFVGETSSDPFVSLSVAAAASHCAVLGTAVALAFPRSPMIAAVAAWDLQRASDGRFVLGLGSQVRKSIERRYSSTFDRPAARLREYVMAVRACWDAFAGHRSLDHRGEFYSLDFLPDMLRPTTLATPPPPIYIAALGPTMFRNAGEVADGAIVHPLHTLDYLRETAEPAIEDGLALSGRARDSFTLSVTALAIVAESKTEAERETVRSQFAFYAATPAYRPILDRHGWGPINDTLCALMADGASSQEMAKAVPDEVLEAFCVVADTWPGAIAAARQRYRGIADRVMFQAPIPASVVVPR